MKHLFVINPVAGGTNRSTEIYEKVKKAFENREDSFEVYITNAPQDAIEAVRKRCETGEELRIYACGGDGTIHEVANSLAQSQTPMAVIPLGTGNDFTRFAGSNNNTFYKGYVFGGQVDYMYRLSSDNALSFSACTEHGSYEKILSDLNRLPLNRLNVNRFTGEISWQHSDKTAIQMRIEAYDRNGFDNVFGDATGNIYPKIGSRRQYEGNSMTASLSALQRFILNNGTSTANGRTTLALLPSVAYNSFEGKHLGSGNFMRYKNIIYGIDVNAVFSLRRSKFTARAGLHRRNCMKHEADVAESKNTDVAESVLIADNYRCNSLVFT